MEDSIDVVNLAKCAFAFGILYGDGRVSRTKIKEMMSNAPEPYNDILLTMLKEAKKEVKSLSESMRVQH